MKTLMLMGVALLMTTSVARADFFTVRSDATGATCNLGAPGFNPNAVVFHKFTLGATGSRFKVTLPPGSAFFTFNTPYVPIGTLTSDLSLGYGQCLVGSINLGTIVAIYTVGTLEVLPADNFASIIFTDCLFAELPGDGGPAYVGIEGACDPLVVEPSTWGKLKSLYR